MEVIPPPFCALTITFERVWNDSEDFSTESGLGLRSKVERSGFKLVVLGGSQPCEYLYFYRWMLNLFFIALLTLLDNKATQRG